MEFLGPFFNLMRTGSLVWPPRGSCEAILVETLHLEDVSFFQIFALLNLESSVLFA